MNKEVNIYSFNDECYVYLGDYKKLQQENKKYKEVIDELIDYLETKRIREKAIIDIDVLEGILKEVE